MTTNFKLNRELAKVNGVDARLIYVSTKQEGYGRQGVYVTFNEYHFGQVEELYLGSVFPNVREHFDTSDDDDRTITEIVIENYQEKICEHLENVEDETEDEE